MVSKDYPRFIKEDNIVDVEDEEYQEGDELYEGNIFENFEEKLAEAANLRKEEHHHDHDCDCDHDHHKH